MIPGGSQYSMPLKQSKTMPQLHYTRDDIQEQYTAVSSKEAASKLHQTGRHQSGSKKRQQRHHHHEFSSPHDSGDELTDSTADGGENIRSSRSMKRKRQRRSRSASFFSGCFALPNTIRSRSFLSHLGFAANSSSSPMERRNSGGDRRRISESKTLVNLKQHTSMQPSPSSGGSSNANNNNNDPSSGFARKHVSFGSGQKGNQQQQSTSTPDEGVIDSPENQDGPANEGAVNSNQDVIVNRGHPQAREQTQMAGTSKVPTIAEGKNILGSQQRQHDHNQQQQQPQQQQSQPPIYLVSQGPGAMMQAAPGLHRSTVLYQRPQGGSQSSFNYISHQHPTAIMPVQAIYHNQTSHQVQPQLHGPVYVPPMALQPTTTLYRRLPVAPMQTRATQTEITAYHLMASPPYGSATSSQAGSRPESCKRQQQNIVRTSQQNTEVAASASFSSSPCSKILKDDETLNLDALESKTSSKPTAKSHQFKSPYQKDDESLKSGESPLLGLSSEACSADNEGGTSAPKSRGIDNSPRRERSPTKADDVSGDDGGVDDNDDDNECGNLNASTLASSSSRSSSSTSLVAHDSTLANTLVNYEPLEDIESRSEDRKQRASIIISASNIGATAPTIAQASAAQSLPPSSSQAQPAQVRRAPLSGGEERTEAGSKLKFDGEREVLARDGPKAAPNSNYQVDPPSQFKDTRRLTDSTTRVSHSRQRQSPVNDDEPLSMSEASSQTDPALAQHIIDISQSMSRSFEDENEEALEKEEEEREQQRRLESDCSTPIAEARPAACETPTMGDLKQFSGAPPADSDIHYGTAQQNTNRTEGGGHDYRNKSESRDAADSQQLGPTKRAQASPTERRRDEFLTMDEFELALAASTSRNNISGELAREKSTTSTLSTRHHSYCGSDDFNPTNVTHHHQHQQQADPMGSNQEGAQLIGAAGSIGEELASPPEGRSSDNRSLEADGEDDESSLPICAGGNNNAAGEEEANREREEQRKDIGGNKVFADPIPLVEPPRPDAKEAKEEEEEADEDGEARKEEDDDGAGASDGASGSSARHKLMASTNGPDKVESESTIRQPESAAIGSGAQAANTFMIAGSHGSSYSDERGEENSETAAAASAYVQQAHTESDIVSASAFRESGRARGKLPSLDSAGAGRSLSSTSSSSSSKSNGEGEDGSDKSRSTAVSAIRASNSTLSSGVSPRSNGSNCGGLSEAAVVAAQLVPADEDRSPSVASPPTTVSELDLDEELSTPSFVDSYRNRLGQVCQFAGEFSAHLMQECLMEALARGQTRNEENSSGGDVCVTSKRQEPLRHKPPTPSGSSSSSSNNGECSSAQMAGERAAENSSFSSPPSTIDDSSLGIEEAKEFSPIAAPAISADKDETHSNSKSSTVVLSSEDSSLDDHRPDALPASASASAGSSDRFRHAPQAQSQRPELPRKPAHLKFAAKERSKGGGEAAAAIAVTATSIAAAAVRHSNYPAPIEVGLARPLEKIEPTGQTSRQAAPMVAAAAAATTSMTNLEGGDGVVGPMPMMAAAISPAANAVMEESSNEPKATGEQIPPASRSGSVCSTNSVIDASERMRARQSLECAADIATRASQVEAASTVEHNSPTTTTTSQATTTTSATGGLRAGKQGSVSLQATLGSERSLSSSCELERVEEPKQGDGAGSDANGSRSSERTSDGDSAAANKDDDDDDDDDTKPAECGGGGDTIPARHQVTASASQELSTVSEVSEEISQQQQQQQQQQQHKQAADLPVRKLSTTGGSEQQLGPSSERKQLDGESADLLATTEQDLANSEYTLRSSAPSTSAKLAASPALSTEDAEAATVPGQRNDAESSTAASRAAQQQQQLGLVRVPSREEQRRRSLGSSGSANSASSIVCTTRALAGTKSPAFDCPYVHDIIPLSPPPLTKSCAADGLQQARIGADGPQQEIVAPRSIARRLSHDDTMEAIEDDIEGEEQELREQQQQQQLHQILDIEPPAAFGHHLSPLPEPIREADDENDDDEADEESSISVSQHGVIVSQEVGPSINKRLKTSTPSVSMSSSSSSPSSTSSSSGEATPSKSGPALAAASGDKIGGGIYPQTSGGDNADGEAQAKRSTSVEIRDDGDGRLAPNKSHSSESATNAILDHLAHHHRDMTLDEPAPQLEQSRSVNPQLRRESWRRESGSARHHTPTHKPITSGSGSGSGSGSASASADDEGDSDGKGDGLTLLGKENIDPGMDQANTSTIKRGTKLAAAARLGGSSHEETGSSGAIGAGADAAEATVAQKDSEIPSQGTSSDDQLASKPISQSRQQQQRQASQVDSQTSPHAQPHAQTSLPTDTSICSSCSCLETAGVSMDQDNGAQEQATTTTSATTATTSTTTTNKQPAKMSEQQRSSETWMSQEEGTVYTENYWLSHWLYISEHEEAEIWRRAIDMSQPAPSSSSSSSCPERDQSEQSAGQTEQLIASGMPKDMVEVESTNSERNFSSKYKSTTRKMIHRRATIEMYKRIANNNLKREKRVEISRSNGEFGFRIHGSRPVVVSAIERGTAAETCGLQVGDLIYAINGTNILDMAHSDVVKLAHSAESSSLVLDLVPTNDFLRMSKYSKSANKLHEPTVTGYLMRLSPSTAQPLLIELQEQMSKTSGVTSQQRAAKLTEVMRLAWRRRYFVLRSDNCLYWYRSPTDIEPYGGINLQGFSASLTNEFSEPSYVIRLVKYGGQPHYFGTNNVCDIQTWVDAINKAATEANQNDPYMKRTLMLARTKPSQISEPDCCGYLYKFSHKKSGGAHWRAAYFVLKDACLFLFRDQQAETVNQASAVYYLHGYRLRSKHIERKRHTFELIPPNRKTIRPMFLMANSEIDKKRWIAALEYSIDRWIEID